MRVPRLRWPASADQGVVKYRLYRWQNDRPIAPTRILETTALPVSMTIIVPLAYQSSGVWALPLDPGLDAVTAVRVDGLSVAFQQKGRLLELAAEIEPWRLSEATMTLPAIEVLDMSATQPNVVYFGPVPKDETTIVTITDIEEQPLVGAQLGRVHLIWQRHISTGGGSYYRYEVTAIDVNARESRPSPIAEVRLSGIGNIQYTIQRSEDGVTWAPSGTSQVFSIDLSGSTIAPNPLTNLSYTVTRDIPGATATIHLGWDPVPATRSVQSSRYRVMATTAGQPVGPFSEQVGPLPLTIPNQNVTIRSQIGAVSPGPTGATGLTELIVPANAVTADVTLTQSNQTKRFGLFVEDANGLYSTPVVIEAITGDLADGLSSITITPV